MLDFKFTEQDLQRLQKNEYQVEKMSEWAELMEKL